MTDPNTTKGPPLDLEWIEADTLTVDQGGEGVRSWYDYINFYQAEVPGGVLVMAVRDETPGGLALAFVPTTTPEALQDRQRILDAIKETG